MSADQLFDDIFYTVRDGLKLHARRYLAPGTAPKGRPAVCLPGLTRNCRDFHQLALALSSDPQRPRDVHALSFRGRGLSEHDRNWKNYTVPTEMLDVADYMTMAELSGAAMIGTSRGGLVTMVLATAQPARVGVAVLNDIGPVIEAAGLTRIASYVGRTPQPKSWRDAAQIVLDLNRRDFPKMSIDSAEILARQLFSEKNGRPVAGYDPKIARSLSVLDGPPPQLWPQFDALKHAPLMVIRGANSDLLSDATVQEMLRRHPRAEAITAPDEGHAPLLNDAPMQAAIAGFLKRTDALTAPLARPVQAPAAAV